MKLFLIVCLGLIFVFPAWARRPQIVILATGGTIAGVADLPSGPDSYDPGQLMIEAVLREVPELKRHADITGEQLRDPEIEDAQKSYINIGSFLLSEKHRLILTRRLRDLLAREDIDGVIVTHGTDTLEETAFFLSLTLSSKKPVLLVGAVRPSNYRNSDSPEQKPDGPLNLLDAIKVIAHERSLEKGVMVVMGGKIHSAFDVTKLRMVKPSEDLSKVTPFSSPHFGPLGQIKNGVVLWNEIPNLEEHIKKSKRFDIPEINKLPLVPIVYASAGQAQFIIDAIKSRSEIKAVVIVGTGEGSLDQTLLNFLREFQCLDEKNIVMQGCEPRPLQFIRSSRSSFGFLRENYYFTRSIGSGTLTPTKAQILAQLVLLNYPSHLPFNYESFRSIFVPQLVGGWH